MTKFIEIKEEDHSSRFKVEGISVDDFIDIFLTTKEPSDIKYISEIDFESHHLRKYYISMNVDGRFNVTHYMINLEKSIEERWKKVAIASRKSNDLELEDLF